MQKARMKVLEKASVEKRAAGQSIKHIQILQPLCHQLPAKEKDTGYKASIQCITSLLKTQLSVRVKISNQKPPYLVFYKTILIMCKREAKHREKY